MVIVNLYPFFENVNKDISLDEKVEFIDIGGPSMLRSAAKNFKSVAVITRCWRLWFDQNKKFQKPEIHH